MEGICSPPNGKSEIRRNLFASLATARRAQGIQKEGHRGGSKGWRTTGRVMPDRAWVIVLDAG